MKKLKLPDVPSELILLALNDLELIEKNPNYIVNMTRWHDYCDVDQICYACFAGAVMAGTLRSNFREVLDPHDFGKNYNKLAALDAFRLGDIILGLHEMGIHKTNILSDYFRVTPYQESPKAWKIDMMAMVDFLKSKGH